MKGNFNTGLMHWNTTEQPSAAYYFLIRDLMNACREVVKVDKTGLGCFI